MSSYVCNLIHFVWSTHGRKPLIGEAWSDQLYAYLGGILRNQRAKLLAAGGRPDHVHRLASLTATVSLAEIAGTLKSNSSCWVHEEHQTRPAFQWQEKYGAFSVSKSAVDRVVRYIHSQVEHHRQRTFQEEFIHLLEKHGIEYDRRYLWA